MKFIEKRGRAFLNHHTPKRLHPSGCTETGKGSGWSRPARSVTKMTKMTYQKGSQEGPAPGGQHSWPSSCWWWWWRLFRVGRCRRVRGWFSAFSLPSIYMHLPDLVKSSPESNYLLCKLRKLYWLLSWAPKNTCLLERCLEELNKNVSYTQLVNKGVLLYNEWFVLSKQEHCLNRGCYEMEYGNWWRKKEPVCWKCLTCTHHITYARQKLGSGRLSWYNRVGWQEDGTL